MKTSKLLLLSMALICSFSSCDSDEPIIPDTPNNKTNTTTSGREKGVLYFRANPLPYVSVNEKANFASTRVAVDKFEYGNKVGLFIDSNDRKDNLKAEFVGNDTDWKMVEKVKLTDKGKLYVYHPYEEGVKDKKKMLVDVSKQQDVMYAQAEVSPEKNVAEVEMKRALSLIVVKVKAEGNSEKILMVEKVKLNNVRTKGMLDITTGVLTQKSEIGSLENEVMQSIKNRDVETSFVVLPVKHSDEEKNVEILITVDGKERVYNVHREHVWKEGEKSIYTIYIPTENNKVSNFNPKAIDVAYWSTFGKSDVRQEDIVDESNKTRKDFGYFDDEGDWIVVNEPLIWGRMVMQYYQKLGGREVVRGEVFCFTPEIEGGRNKNRKGDWEAEIKMSLWQNGRMVEQFPAKKVLVRERDRGYSTSYECYITAPVGRYQLRTLVREKGSNVWVIPDHDADFGRKEDWIFDVVEKPTTPSIRKMTFNGNTGFLHNAKTNEVFHVNAEITNRTDLPIKGEIKAVWMRKYDGTMHEKGCIDWGRSINDRNFPDSYITEEWEDEIGRIKIDLDPSVKSFHTDIECKYTKDRKTNENARNAGIIALFFKGDNDNEWRRMRPDYDWTLEELKTANGEDKHRHRLGVGYGEFRNFLKLYGEDDERRVNEKSFGKRN